jgi:hypothetical protein
MKFTSKLTLHTSSYQLSVTRVTSYHFILIEAMVALLKEESMQFYYLIFLFKIYDVMTRVTTSMQFSPPSIYSPIGIQPIDGGTRIFDITVEGK